MPQLPTGRLAASVLMLMSLSHTLPGQAGEKPRRVVSLNLCTDQLLLALADPDQIGSLSFLARDRTLSFLSDQASAFPANEGKGEAILFGHVDLVLAGGFGAHTKRELLERHGVEVMALDGWQGLEHGREQIRLVARRLGHSGRGEAMVEAIDAALEKTRGIVPSRRSILTTYRRGWVPASDSLISEVLRHMGFTLHQEALGLGRGGVARLESVVATPPDYALMDEVTGRSIDNGSALLVHPALVDAIPPERRLVLPGKLAICGGPATVAMIEALAEEVRAKVR
jgi:iron complex transport system substrate-binding protein